MHHETMPVFACSHFYVVMMFIFFYQVYTFYFILQNVAVHIFSEEDIASAAQDDLLIFRTVCFIQEFPQFLDIGECSEIFCLYINTESVVSFERYILLNLQFLGV